VARKLSLEVAEAAAVERFAMLQELSRQLRPCGVRLGLEHAGARLGQIERLFDAGLEFVKLDAAATRGAGSEPQRMRFVQCSVELLHSLALQVYAEGVGEDDDARALWACGIDAVTGPWATERMSV
jgi:EAL domain-containing protein (putative c-di-GMP-specific phosphodiesterase class I)